MQVGPPVVEQGASARDNPRISRCGQVCNRKATKSVLRSFSNKGGSQARKCVCVCVCERECPTLRVAHKVFFLLPLASVCLTDGVCGGLSFLRLTHILSVGCQRDRSHRSLSVCGEGREARPREPDGSAQGHSDRIWHACAPLPDDLIARAIGALSDDTASWAADTAERNFLCLMRACSFPAVRELRDVVDR
jgi:hypothetical protein